MAEETFSKEARQVVVRAQEVAREFGHSTIDTGDLLLGIFGDDNSVAAQALNRCGMTQELVRERLASITTTTSRNLKGQIPFGGEAREVLGRVLLTATSLGDASMKAEHILIVLEEQEGGPADAVISEFCSGVDALRLTIMELRGDTDIADED